MLTGSLKLEKALDIECFLLIKYYQQEFGADGGNRTRVISLEGWSNTIIRHPRNLLQVT